MEKKQIIFLSFYRKNYSRSAVLLNSSSDIFERVYYKLNNNAFGLILGFRKILKLHQGKIAAVVVMSPSHKIIPLIRILCHHPLILDAGWPLIDGSISRRSAQFRWRMTTISSYVKLLVIDFLSFALADLVLVETNSQKWRIRRQFFLKESKIKVSFTGFNEVGEDLGIKNQDGKSNLVKRESKKLIKILFRGKINYESGFSNIAEAFKLLDDRFAITYVVNKIPEKHVKHPNEKFITGFKDGDLTSIYKETNICIGQVSSHKRLEVTIPHKAFEAAFFSKAYISANNSAIREFASESEVFLLDEPNPESLSRAILTIAADENLCNKLGKNFNKKYHELASQKVLGDQLDKWVTTMWKAEFGEDYRE